VRFLEAAVESDMEMACLPHDDAHSNIFGFRLLACPAVFSGFKSGQTITTSDCNIFNVAHRGGSNLKFRNDQPMQLQVSDGKRAWLFTVGDLLRMKY